MFFTDPPEALAQVSPAGTLVQNTARMSFDAGSGAASVNSNTVSTRVATMFGLRLSPHGTVAAPAFSQLSIPGDTLYFRFTVANLANVPDSPTLSFSLHALSTLPVTQLIFFLDSNGNTHFDPGEDNPAFLALSPGASTPMDVGVVLPPLALGTAFVELHATSTADPSSSPASDISVLRVTARRQPPAIYFGPVGNPRAMPGGERTPDDGTWIAVGPLDDTIKLRGEIENVCDVDTLNAFIVNSAELPPGSVVACTDTSGVPYPTSRPGHYLIGVIASGATRHIDFAISTPGIPIRRSLAGVENLRCLVQSRLDSLVTNTTDFHLRMPAVPDPRAMIGLDQTFRQATAAVGDVASMIVTVTNLTDSITVDNVSVVESPPSSLDFSSGDGVTFNGHSIAWDAGTLGPGESRSATVRFVVNSREAKGWARVSGSATGLAETGDNVTAGPVVAAIRIDNEEIGIEGVILGDVFVDENANNKRDENEHGVVNSRQAAAEIGGLCEAGANLLHGIDERLDAPIAVARLAGKITLGVRRVLHEERVRRTETARVGC